MICNRSARDLTVFVWQDSASVCESRHLPMLLKNQPRRTNCVDRKGM
jgi:hypothetical protein